LESAGERPGGSCPRHVCVRSTTANAFEHRTNRLENVLEAHSLGDQLHCSLFAACSALRCSMASISIPVPNESPPHFGLVEVLDEVKTTGTPRRIVAAVFRMDRGLRTFAVRLSKVKPVNSSHRLLTKSTEQSRRLDHASAGIVLMMVRNSLSEFGISPSTVSSFSRASIWCRLDSRTLKQVRGRTPHTRRRIETRNPSQPAGVAEPPSDGSNVPACKR
jgi:hypothetical protein